ncbi:P-loop containing nucleoside triphosphate hydrolase protein [Dactylonectria macrodidyma]|uniref:ATP-dependent RNA helicase n=1 Tax=Dactylonectria macrodidyma TaxID=307937 RepID=A0A9P9JCW6_9HYPO|nr:P-loop containing nucleoside triphosphate hydrolase protein [Dactylonectria macrodidyma]
MFRNSLRRCANQARATATASLLSQTRTTLPISRRQLVPVLTTISPLNRIASISRAYSSEAPAAENETPVVTTTEEATKFSHLEGVHPNLVEAITRGMGYDDMTPVQAKTINPALKGTDIVAQAKTGTGKTLAFLLPLLQRMLVEDPSLARKGAKFNARANDIRGIVLSPTRELAEQIAVEARRLTRNTGLVVQCAVGGTDKRGMLQRTRRDGCHLLVATPGRLNDLLSDPRSGIEAPNLAALVLDEADRMLDVGFERELNEIVGQLPNTNEKTRQTMLVSATIPDNVIRLARTMVRAHDFEFVQTIAENDSLTHAKVPQKIAPVTSWTNVFPTLFELVDREVAKSKEDPNGRPFKAIVYFNTTSLVELAGELAHQRERNASSHARPIASYVLQSRLTQGQRQKAADSFRRAKEGILMSSDVTARGMDFPDVTHVIQVDTPRDRESYIHRLGRTGRQNKEGEGWLIIPHASVPSARKMLKGLPITQDATLESAETDTVSGESTPTHLEMKNLFGVMPRSTLASTYTSMFGTATDKIALAEDVNEWAVHGWGWSAPPSVSHKWVTLMGLSRAPGMNISEGGGRRYDGDDRRGGDRRGSYRSDSGRSGGDSFDNMARNAFRDDGGYGGRGGGRDGGRGGGRGGSRRDYGRSSF